VDWIQQAQDMKAVVNMVMDLWSLRVMKYIGQHSDLSFSGTILHGIKTK
jgi:hypothetical protein